LIDSAARDAAEAQREAGRANLERLRRGRG
jgi:hypothetical protein